MQMFERLNSDRSIFFKLNGELNESMAAVLYSDIHSELESDNHFDSIVLSLQTHSLHHRALKKLGAIGFELKRARKLMYLLSKNPITHRMIRAEGLENIIQPISSTSEIEAPAVSADQKQGLDTEVLNPLIDAVIHVFKREAKTVITPGKPVMNLSKALASPIEISAMLQLHSKSFNGALELCFSNNVFLGIMSRLRGEYFSQLNESLEQEAADLLKQIFSQAKNILSRTDHKLSAGEVTVMRNNTHPAGYVASKYILTVPFKCDFGHFHIEIGRENRGN